MENKAASNEQFSNYISDIEKSIDNTLIEYVQVGYLKSLAKVLAYIGIENRENLLESFSSEQKEFILKEIESNSWNRSDYEVMEETSRILSESDLFSDENINTLIEKRKTVNTEFYNNLTEEMETKNPIIGLVLDKFNIRFSYIPLFDDRAIQHILRAVDTETLGTALAKSPEEIQEKIFRNMSKRAAQMLKEDIEFLGPISDEKILEAREKICMEIRKLVDSKRISLNV